MAQTLLTRAGLWLSLSIALYAQRPGGAGLPPGKIPSLSSITNSPTADTNGTELQRPVYVEGKVILEDGTAPSESITIQMICGGTPRSIGFTDMKGRFDLDMNDRKNASAYSDASQSGPYSLGAGGSSAPNTRPQAGGAGSTLTARNYAACDLMAALAGFRSDRVSLASHRALEDPNVGTIVLHRVANVEGTTISVTSTFAPKDAKKLYEKGLIQEQKGKWPDAQRELQKAVDLYPKYASAWFHLGYTKQAQNDLVGARTSYAKALEADPRLVSPYQELAFLDAREEKWPEVAENTDRLLALNPVDFPDAWMYNAMAKFQLQNFDAAEKSARQGLSNDPNHKYPKLDQILGVILVQKHEYPEAAQHMRSYLHFAPEASDAALVQKQLSEVERKTTPHTTTAKAPEKH
jgi:tetratricopeptide (TPR) repeat protein